MGYHSVADAMVRFGGYGFLPVATLLSTDEYHDCIIGPTPAKSLPNLSHLCATRPVALRYEAIVQVVSTHARIDC